MNKIENTVSVLDLMNLHQNIVFINGGVCLFVFPRKQRLTVWVQD